MQKYKIWDFEIDSIELKCLSISKGIKVDKNVYKMWPVCKTGHIYLIDFYIISK